MATFLTVVGLSVAAWLIYRFCLPRHWVCPKCGADQSSSARCTACGWNDCSIVDEFRPVTGAQSHLPILKRVGGILLAVGLIDIAVFIYCIINRISYSSGLNVFAVLAGVFLLRGSLRAASIVRWFAVFMLAAFAALVVTWPFAQPIGLTLTQFRLNPAAFIVTGAFMTVLFTLLYWVVRELGSEPIQTARINANRKQRNMRIPAAIGISLAVVGSVLLTLLHGSEIEKHAKSIAAQELGPDYSYHVSSLRISKTSQETVVAAIVTAWKNDEIKNVPVRWQEP